MLGRAVVPRRYVLELELSAKLDSFSARLTVDVDCAEPVSCIVLNAHPSLVISSLAVDGAACNFSHREPEELAVALPAAQRPRQLTLEYVGVIGTDSIGLYQNTFGGQPGVASQLFSTYARRVLPCWDEPAFKAVFEVRVVLQAAPGRAAEVRSNAPLARVEEAGPGRRRWVFEPTPVMSAYLLALFVGECAAVTRHTRRGGRPVSVLVPRGQEASGAFAADVAVRAVHFFEDLFGVELPVPKVDLVGLLSFLYGGMENWGCIFFQDYILYTAAGATHQQRQTCASVVCHEIAHNWFGNLVTIDWWHSLWLSEGFATAQGWAAVAALFPEWDVPPLLFLDETRRGLEQDSNRATHPVEIDAAIRDPQAIMALIDSISYCKGMACVMIAQDLLGEALFRQRLGGYLARHAFSNASTDQLWEALGLGAEMQHWVRVAGHPVVSAARGPGGVLALAQERFFASGERQQGGAPWAVSLSARRRGSEQRRQIRLDAATAEVADAADVVLLTGVFCRVHYCDALFSDVLASVSLFSSLEAVSLLDGQVALARGGRGSARRVLELLQALRGAAPSAHVASAVLDAVADLKNAFAAEKRLAEYQRQLAAQVLAHESDAEIWQDVHLRCRGIAFDPALYEPHFAAWQSRGMAELGFIFRAAAQKPEHFEALAAIGRDARTDSNVQRLALTQLGGNTRDTARLEQLLLSLPSGMFRTVFLAVKDYPFLVSFVERHWHSFIMPTCGGTVSVSGVWTHAMGQKSVEEIGKAFAALPAEQQSLMRDKVDNLKEFLTQREAWRQRDLPLVTQFFDSLMGQ